MDLWRLEFLGVDVLNCIANFSYCDTFSLGDYNSELKKSSRVQPYYWFNTSGDIAVYIAKWSESQKGRSASQSINTQCKIQLYS